MIIEKIVEIKLREGSLSGSDGNRGIQIAAVWDDKILIESIYATDILKRVNKEKRENFIIQFTYNINVILNEMRARNILEMDEESYNNYKKHMYQPDCDFDHSWKDNKLRARKW